MFSVAVFASLLALAGSSLAQEGAGAAASVAQLVGNLRRAPSEVDLIRRAQDDQFLFDFAVDPSATVGGVTNGAGGHAVAATAENFPAVDDNGAPMTMSFLGLSGIACPTAAPAAVSSAASTA